MNSRGGTLRAQWLGKLLRDLRESAGVSFQDAAYHVMRDPSTISRMEIGSLPARLSDLRELLNLYGVADPHVRAGLEQLTRDIWMKGWWDGYAGNVQVRMIDLAWLESRAEQARNFSLPAIHGLLQTRDYTEALMRAIDPDVSGQRIAQWVDFRMKRQEVLGRLDYTAILDEAIFHRTIGSPGVMREQLAHLLDLSERPNITVRVLPSSVSLHAGPESAFTLFTMPAPFPVVAHVNTDAGAIYVEMPKAVRFEAAYARLERHALDVEDSRTFLNSRMEQLS
jgi:transcriptional regulator with XRE-family HTH domain